MDVPVYLIPVSALDTRIPIEQGKRVEGQVPVFVVNNDTAEKRLVTVRDIRGNDLEVVEGLATGDQLIVAGVPFIEEGQKVKLWEPAYNLPATINAQQ